MSTLISDIPKVITTHLQDVIKTFGLPDDEDTMDRLLRGWQEKEDAFQEKMIELGMEEVAEFDLNDERIALALTYSGSLITFGPVKDDGRKVEYTSIGFRQDVPATLTIEDAQLAAHPEVGHSLEFTQGALKNTSPLFKLVVSSDSLSEMEQEELAQEATTIIVDTFVDMNKDIIS